jgi:hypothetical protein
MQQQSSVQPSDVRHFWSVTSDAEEDGRPRKERLKFKIEDFVEHTWHSYAFFLREGNSAGSGRTQRMAHKQAWLAFSIA